MIFNLRLNAYVHVSTPINLLKNETHHNGHQAQQFRDNIMSSAHPKKKSNPLPYFEVQL